MVRLWWAMAKRAAFTTRLQRILRDNVGERHDSSKCRGTLKGHQWACVV